MMKTFTCICVFFFSAVEFAHSQPSLSLSLFSAGYNGPLDITHCGDSRLFIVQRNGFIYICDSNGVKNPVPFLNISNKVETSGGEQGLLGLCFHPDYANNGFFYVGYTAISSGENRVSRFSRDAVNPDRADSLSEQILLSVTDPYSNHNGGCVKFGHDGFLYFGTGDGGSFGDPLNNGQNNLSFLGKMLRFDVDNGTPYSVPVTNPFQNDVTYKPEIWATGLRNPWRFSFDRVTGDLWISDVGQNVWEEINFQPASSPGGEDYGWRCYEGNHPYNTAGCDPMNTFDFPVYEYTHGSTSGCSVTGGFMYRGAQNSSMFGHYIFVDYCSGQFRGITKDMNGNWVGSDLVNLDDYNYSSFGEDRYGELYVAGLSSGNIYKISDTTVCKPKAFIEGDPVRALCSASDTLHAIAGANLLYQWRLNGTNVPGGNSPDLVITQSGVYDIIVYNLSICSDTSDPVTVTIGTPPLVPNITLNGLQLISDPSVSYQWFVNGVLIPGATSQTFTPYMSGTFTVEVTDSTGCSSLSAGVVYNLGQNESLNFNGTKLFPNPVRAGTSFSLIGLPLGNYYIKISDMMGKRVYEENIFSKGMQSSITISLPVLSSGVHVAMLSTGNEQVSLKLLVE
jgi:glucose/arabinose dehydrogenase